MCVYVLPGVHTHAMFVCVCVCGVCDMYDVCMYVYNGVYAYDTCACIMYICDTFVCVCVGLGVCVCYVSVYLWFLCV